MLIYRLEHEDSKMGVWTHTVDTHKLTDAYDNINYRGCDGEHPNLYEDFDLETKDFIFESHWKCATYSLEHFHSWFDFDWLELMPYGFRVYQIEIDTENVIVGRAQVCFDPTKVISQRKILLNEYVERLNI